MGKYMRRAKTTADFPAMDVSPQSSFGVRTRAKTLALQRLQSPSASPVDCFSFLQLRSRRLEKLPPLATKPKDACKETVRSSPNPDPKLKASPCAESVRQSRAIELSIISGAVNYSSLVSAVPPSPENDAEIEAEVSCGENMFEVEELNRKMRETTPSNLIRGSQDIETPGSSTRPSANRRSWSSVYRNIPTTSEMEEFFTGAEQSQMKLFTEKYNYDLVNDRPLPGRYEWAKLG
ncbi:Cyclin-dependent kinase inhibitor 3 [Platanthera zijinensis]|uniref:Cyclin-dependent kinase inhibitor 3 n=1 Tax=Platanthera zijinensis TaxID=2320716 RepID=A0AAP0B9W0_9ASPA